MYKHTNVAQEALRERSSKQLKADARVSAQQGHEFLKDVYLMNALFPPELAWVRMESWELRVRVCLLVE